jgi:hypothetical protein
MDPYIDTTNPEHEAIRSKFVTRLAWVAVALGFLLAINALLHTGLIPLSAEAIQREAITSSSLSAIPVPGFARFISDNLHVLYGCLFFLWLAIFVSGIGLLFRRNWGRVMFVSASWVYVAYAWSAFIFIAIWDLSTPAYPGDTAKYFYPVTAIVVAVLLFAAVKALALSILTGWIGRRLWSDRHRREFQATTETTTGGGKEPDSVTRTE